MAIEKTNFTGTTAEEKTQEVYNWLSANAAEYFDSIQESEGVISCIIGEKTALEISLSSSRAEMTVMLNSEKSKSSYNTLADLSAAIKTDCGIFMTINGAISVMVSKTTAGTTAFAVRVYNSADDFRCVTGDFIYSADFTELPINASEMTTIAPCVFAANVYCENMMYCAFTQFPNMVIDDIIIENNHYTYNGVVALKE